MPDFQTIRDLFARVRGEIRKAVVGQEEGVDLLLAALLARGHVLLEGIPGTAKTLLARSVASALGGSFKRIQMTPDLMPSDLLGVNMLDMKTGAFRVQKGPIFCDFALADEVNRAPAKTQSAMLECMGERQVTIEGQRFPLSPVFTVIATQNPIEFEGTYPLPEAQLDRFLFKLDIPCPSPDDERAILRRHEGGFRADALEEAGIAAVAPVEELRAAQAALVGVKTAEPVLGYIVELVNATRGSAHILVGAGPRASIGLHLASKAVALLDGREFATPDDVKRVAKPVLRHRIVLRPEAEIEGFTADACLDQLLAGVKVPR